MSEYRIAVLVGSLRRESFNRKLAEAIRKMGPPEFSFHDSRIDDLPLYNQDNDGNQSEQVKRLKSEISAAQGVLFVTPEYNRSVPEVLKNAIDQASRPYGQSAWKGKPAGVLGLRWAPRGRAWRSSICGTFWRILMRPRWGSPKYSFTSKRGCSIRTATSAMLIRNSSCKRG